MKLIIYEDKKTGHVVLCEKVPEKYDNETLKETLCNYNEKKENLYHADIIEYEKGSLCDYLFQKSQRKGAKR